MSEKIVDRITYSQSIRINIGDYESNDIFVSMSTDIQKGETPDIAYKRIKKFVDKKIIIEDKKIRTSSKTFVDFKTMKKLKKRV